jgi:nucleoid-associated protein YgaU
MTTKIVVDCSTGVVEEVELTEEELAQREADRLAFEAAEAERLAEEAVKAAKKAELLAKLGITEDDAKLLLS